MKLRTTPTFPSRSVRRFAWRAVHIGPVADGSFHAVACQFLGDVGLNQFRQRDIAVSAPAIAFPPFHDSAAVKRAAELRIESERCVVVEKRAVELAEPQIGN